jgi:AraC-like DNA-binding protein
MRRISSLPPPSRSASRGSLGVGDPRLQAGAILTSDLNEESEEGAIEYELSCSVRLVKPFLKVLPASARPAPEVLAELDAMSVDHRLPMAVLNQMLEVTVNQSGDHDIGLKAARECSPGDAGVLDYAISSASTVKSAIDTASRYVRLVNDGLDLRLEMVAGEARMVLENRAPLPRAALDFQVAGIFQAFSPVWASGPRPSLRVFFEHPRPDDVTEYRRTFGSTPLHFGAEFCGFAFDASWLTAALGSADSRLHEVILKHAEKMLSELPRARQLTERVRSAIVDELAGGDPSVTHIAPRLRMSPRTLERKLEREGTTFSALLEDLRKRLALRYVGSENLELAEIAFLLGFSQTTGFHRAFKRWTGCTPLSYRASQRAQRGDRVSG